MYSFFEGLLTARVLPSYIRFCAIVLSETVLVISVNNIDKPSMISCLQYGNACIDFMVWYFIIELVFTAHYLRLQHIYDIYIDDCIQVYIRTVMVTSNEGYIEYM